MIKCEERYNKSKMVHSIMRHVAEKTNTPLETLYQAIAWPLNKKYGHSLDALRLSITNPEVWQDIVFPTEPVKQELFSYVSKRLTPQPTKIRADIEVTCFAEKGIDAIREALVKAEDVSTSDLQIKVRLISPPLYVLTCQCLDKTIGIEKLEQAIKDVEANIKADKGDLKVKMAPKAVTENDDAELQALMDQRERENQQVSGDEDDSESDEGADV